MKREILFRGKRIDNNQWIYGGYFQASEEDGLGTYIYDHYAGAVLVKLDTVGQFTGLPDKNGVKIFEGDIVFRSGHDVKSTIEWVEKYMCFAGKIDSTLYGFYQQIDMPFIEVIGNIHDNTTTK